MSLLAAALTRRLVSSWKHSARPALTHQVTTVGSASTVAVVTTVSTGIAAPPWVSRRRIENPLKGDGIRSDVLHFAPLIFTDSHVTLRCFMGRETAVFVCGEQLLNFPSPVGSAYFLLLHIFWTWECFWGKTAPECSLLWSPAAASHESNHIWCFHQQLFNSERLPLILTRWINDLFWSYIYCRTRANCICFLPTWTNPIAGTC